MSRSTHTPLRVLHQQGRQALRSGDLRAALSLLEQAASKTSAREQDYQQVLLDWRSALLKARKVRAALTIDWYRGVSKDQRALLDHAPPIDQARTLQAWAKQFGDAERAAHSYALAASLYQQLGLTAQAAICHELAGDFAAARSLWSKLAGTLGQLDAERYPAGLARFNVARTCRQLGDEHAAHAAVVAAVHLLEEAADRYERIGQRERAFDCFQVLIAIGKSTRVFEHVLEGYVNVVRILRQDNLRYYAIQSYEDAVELAGRHGELSAGATLAKELGQYAGKQGMGAVSRWGDQLQARMWQQVARATVERGGPPEVAENAMLAAVMAHARQSQFGTVGEIYRQLAMLELEQARRQHYARAAQRYQGLEDAPLDAAPLPSHLRQEAAFPDVWHVDLVEWEQRGSAAAACGDVVLDPESWSEVTRRRAMLARLEALDTEEVTGPQRTGALIRLVERLSEVELYTILSPLERLFESPQPEVRAAVVAALERFMYKRSFITVRSALGDDDPGVRKQAYQTVQALRFPHAFDPLARIVREADDRQARMAALRALAHIDTTEAAELLLAVLQNEGKGERQAATEALKRCRGTVFLELARAAAPDLSRGSRKQLDAIFRARGERL